MERNVDLHPVQLGELIGNEEVRRDAIHVAVIPVRAAMQLSPGTHVAPLSLERNNWVLPRDANVGIVDPFLKENVQFGQRFWLLLYPGRILSLRHEWNHTAFPLSSDREFSSGSPLHTRFLKALESNEDDSTMRELYADWLYEKGEFEEAARHRSWDEAKLWLVNFCREYSPEPEPDDYEVTRFTYKEIIRAGHEAIEDDYDDGVFLSCGNNQDIADALTDNCAVFWEMWSTVTGVPLPSNIVGRTRFSCAC